MRAIDRKFPFQSKVAFLPRMGIARYDRNEQRACLDLPAYRGIPRVPAAQLALVEPHLDSRRPQAAGNLRGRHGVLGCVTEENSLFGAIHGQRENEVEGLAAQPLHAAARLSEHRCP